MTHWLDVIEDYLSVKRFKTGSGCRIRRIWDRCSTATIANVNVYGLMK
jgi:hypothetical protein